jgi:hypothetical protein
MKTFSFKFVKLNLMSPTSILLDEIGNSSVYYRLVSDITSVKMFIRAKLTIILIKRTFSKTRSKNTASSFPPLMYSQWSIRTRRRAASTRVGQRRKTASYTVDLSRIRASGNCLTAFDNPKWRRPGDLGFVKLHASRALCVGCHTSSGAANLLVRPDMNNIQSRIHTLNLFTLALRLCSAAASKMFSWRLIDECAQLDVLSTINAAKFKPRVSVDSAGRQVRPAKFTSCLRFLGADDTWSLCPKTSEKAVDAFEEADGLESDECC